MGDGDRGHAIPVTIMRKTAVMIGASVLTALALAQLLDARSRPPRSHYSLTIPLDPPDKMQLPRIDGPSGRPLVILDPGHGGHDPGAITQDNGHYEKQVTLAIARSIRDALLETGKVRVGLTRDGDRFVALAERYEMARAVKAELFISIHADSAGHHAARGATIYTLSETASDQEAARLAERENRADMLNGVDLGNRNRAVHSILIDLSQRETLEASTRFARILHRETQTALRYRDIYFRRASLIVLKAPDVPSVLFEAGYLSNAEDAAFLQSQKGRSALAAGAARAIETYLATRTATR